MSRAKSLKLSYTKEPESMSLRGGASCEESKELPRWKCATCGAVLLERVPEE